MDESVENSSCPPISELVEILKEIRDPAVGVPASRRDRCSEMVSLCKMVSDDPMVTSFQGLFEVELSKNLANNGELRAAEESVERARILLDTQSAEEEKKGDRWVFPGAVQELYYLMGMFRLAYAGPRVQHKLAAERSLQSEDFLRRSAAAYLLRLGETKEAGDMSLEVEHDIPLAVRKEYYSRTLFALAEVRLTYQNHQVRYEEELREKEKKERAQRGEQSLPPPHSLSAQAHEASRLAAVYMYAGLCSLLDEHGIPPRPAEWIARTIQLSSNFLESEEFEYAFTCLSAAQRCLGEQLRNPSPGSFALDPSEHARARGDLHRAFGKFYLAIVLFSRVAAEAGVTPRPKREIPKDVAMSPFALPDDPSQCFPNLAPGGPLPMLNLELPCMTSAAARPLARRARRHFLSALRLLGEKPDHHDWLRVAQDLSQVDRLLAHFIQSEEKGKIVVGPLAEPVLAEESVDAFDEQFAQELHQPSTEEDENILRDAGLLHSRRAKLLDPLLLRFISLPAPEKAQLRADIRVLSFELGEIFNESANSALASVPIGETADKTVGQVMNRAVLTAISRYTTFMQTFQDDVSDSHGPPPATKEFLKAKYTASHLSVADLVPYLIAHFHVARLHQKFVHLDLKQQLRNLERALAEYNLIVDAVEEKGDEASAVLREEVSLSAQMAQMLPLKIAAMASEGESGKGDH